MPRITAALTLVALLLRAQGADAHVFTEHRIGPSEDWCARIQYGVSDGDLVRLDPGDYVGTCVVARSGLPDEGEPLAITGAPGARIIAPPGRPALIVTGDLVRLAGLTLVGDRDAPTVEARGRTLLVDGCTFAGGAIGLDATAAPGALSLIGNTFEDTRQAVAFGCPKDGRPCDRTRAVLRDNLVRARAASPGVAVDVAAGVEIVLEGNVVEGSWQTAARLDGLGRATMALDGNVVVEGTSGQAAVGIALQNAVGVVIRNNAILGTTRAALSLSQANGDVISNTLRTSAGVSVLTDGEAPTRSANAVQAPDVAASDVDCRLPGCWVDATDLRPSLTAPDGTPGRLAGRGPLLAVAGRDLCGRSRRGADFAGAFAAPDAPVMRLAPVSRGESGCFEAARVEELLAERPAEEKRPGGGCGASPGGLTTMWPVLALAAAVLARRLSRAAR